MLPAPPADRVWRELAQHYFFITPHDDGFSPEEISLINLRLRGYYHSLYGLLLKLWEDEAWLRCFGRYLSRDHLSLQNTAVADKEVYERVREVAEHFACPIDEDLLDTSAMTIEDLVVMVQERHTPSG